MSNPLVTKWQGLIDQGRFLDVVEDLEKVRIRVTLIGADLRIDAPPVLTSPELSRLLHNHTTELSVVLRLSTLGTDSYGSTRLYHSVIQNDLAEVRRHLTNGAQPNHENRFGQTPFHAAIALGNPLIIESLAMAGADLAKPDIDGRSPLHLAVIHQHPSIVSFLLANGAPINSGDFFALTPLTQAVGTSQGTLAQLLVEYGATLEPEGVPADEQQFLQLVLRMLQGYSSELYAHSVRVADLARCLARDLELTDDDQKTVRLGGLLHDLGKMSLPDEIFDRADSALTDEEIDLLMSHPEDGAEALPPAWVPSKWPVRAIILHHHEKWDGSGFPQGLSGPAIPLTAQIVGLADYYDHLVTHRDYDPAIPHNQAMAHLNSLAGTHFGEEVLNSLFRVHDLLAFYSPTPKSPHP